MVINNGYLNNINGNVRRSENSPNRAAAGKQPQKGGSFAEILRETIDGSKDIKISKHAEMRLRLRNIDLSPAQMGKLKDAVGKAEDKGIRDSLVLLDNVALVVNVKNRTVVTAVGSNELKDNVFTNIDGAVFA